MTKSKQSVANPGPLAPIWNGMRAIMILARRNGERAVLIDQRLAALEDRIAALDAGEASDSASRTALVTFNTAAVRECRPTLNLIIRSDGKIEWTGHLADDKRAPDDRQ